MHYRLYRHMDATYPCPYMEHEEYSCTEIGRKDVISNSTPFINDKGVAMWRYEVEVPGSPGETFTFEDKAGVIEIFPKSHLDELPASFDLLQFPEGHLQITKVNEQLTQLYAKKLDWTNTHPEIMDDWSSWWKGVPVSVGEVKCDEPFKFPKPQATLVQQQQPGADYQYAKEKGIRAVDIVTHSGLTPAQRDRALRCVDQNCIHENDELEQCNFLLVNLEPVNAEHYPHKFVLARVIEDVSNKETTDPDEEIFIQIYCPVHVDDFLRSGNIMNLWRGSDNKLWKETILRGTVLCKLGNKLTKRNTLTAPMKKILKQYFDSVKSCDDVHK